MCNKTSISGHTAVFVNNSFLTLPRSGKRNFPNLRAFFGWWHSQGAALEGRGTWLDHRVDKAGWRQGAVREGDNRAGQEGTLTGMMQVPVREGLLDVEPHKVN